jgi:hypothetical protein
MPLQERLSCGAIWQITLLDTGGEFAAGLPALHHTGRSLDSCTATCLRVSRPIGENYTSAGGDVKAIVVPVFHVYRTRVDSVRIDLGENQAYLVSKFGIIRLNYSK